MPHRSLIPACALALAVLPLPSLACSGRLHIELEQSGVYTLDHAAIAAAQPALADCAAADLVLTQAGKEVPLRVVAKDARFTDGDRIEWIGQALHGPESWFDPYSVNNVYLLGAAPGAHARMRDAQPEGSGRAALERSLHLEQENLMIRLDQEQQKPGEESDVWQWAKLTQVDPKPFETKVDLPDLDARASTVRLTLNFRGLSDIPFSPRQASARPDDHVVDVTINGHAAATLRWNGRAEVQREVDVPTAWLKGRGNALTMAVSKRSITSDPKNSVVDVVMFNWLEARYPLVGDLTEAALPLRVRGQDALPLQLAYRGSEAPTLYGADGIRRPGHAAGSGRYAFAPAARGVELFPALDGKLAAPTSVRAVADVPWQHPAEGYDYLIVSHPSLAAAVEPLAAFHRQRGLKVAVLDIDSVYDQFNDGIAHPRAIRNLVDAAYHRWPSPRPRFLLLVGDASYDIRHDTYDDGRYAKWVGRELLYPNAFGAIGATPYKNAPQKLAARNLIPTWQYPSAEGQSASDNWFGAVDGDDWHPVVAVGRFPVVEPAEVKAIVDKTIGYFSHPQLGAWRRDVMFITDEIESFKKASDDIATGLGKDGFLADKVYASPKESDNQAHQNAIREGIDDGRLLVHFIGHGGRFIWRTGPPDLRNNNDLFTLDDVDSLTNSQRLPMILSMTCYSAPFDNPTEDSIGEKFLREPGKGAVAVFAASWRNSPSADFSKSIIRELLTPGATIGEAIVHAKKTTLDRTLVEMYNLLGDPAVVLERPQGDARVARIGGRWDDGIAVDLGRPRFDGDVVVDWLDAKGARLSSATYRTHETRFQLPVPSAARGRVADVRVYASSPAGGRDAIGGADFRPHDVPVSKPLRVALESWWRRVTAPAPKRSVRQADTIAIRDFDTAAPVATGAAANVAKQPQARDATPATTAASAR